jgi:hypothetical protein
VLIVSADQGAKRRGIALTGAFEQLIIAGAEHAANGSRFRNVTQRRAGAVGVDVIHVTD